MSGQPYLASEDSAFLRETLSGQHGEICLEIGAGNAGNLVELAGNFRTVIGTDLVKPSMGDWKAKGANFVLADCSSCIRGSCVDLVAFNPPYLKDDGTGDIAVDGGRNLEIPKRFLAEAMRVVKPDGKVVMLLNGDADVGEFQSELDARGFRLRPLASKHLFFEEVSVFVASAT